MHLYVKIKTQSDNQHGAMILKFSGKFTVCYHFFRLWCIGNILTLEKQGSEALMKTNRARGW